MNKAIDTLSSLLKNLPQSKKHEVYVIRSDVKY